ncbi:hypothetical protein Hanom_Chr17g01580571 [Helianthus anomalus]
MPGMKPGPDSVGIFAISQSCSGVIGEILKDRTSWFRDCRNLEVLTILRFCDFAGFSDAINGFNDDGWSLMNCDGAEDVIVFISLTKNIGNSTNSSNPLLFLGGVLCAKALMLFQNVPLVVLVRFLREHRSKRRSFNIQV